MAVSSQRQIEHQLWMERQAEEAARQAAEAAEAHEMETRRRAELHRRVLQAVEAEAAHRVELAEQAEKAAEIQQTYLQQEEEGRDATRRAIGADRAGGAGASGADREEQGGSQPCLSVLWLLCWASEDVVEGLLSPQHARGPCSPVSVRAVRECSAGHGTNGALRQQGWQHSHA